MSKVQTEQKLIDELKAIPEKEFKELLSERKVGHLCLHCKYRKRGNRKCYCMAQYSPWTPDKYKRITAHDEACGLFKVRMTKTWLNS